MKTYTLQSHLQEIDDSTSPPTHRLMVPERYGYAACAVAWARYLWQRLTVREPARRRGAVGVPLQTLASPWGRRWRR